MINRAKKILLITILLIFLSGCWDYEDINKRSITLSVGIDEVDDKITLTGEIAKLVTKDSKGGSTASVTDVYNYVSEGKDFEEARSDFDNKIPLTDFSGASRSIVFCKGYAEKKGIESYINRLSFIPGFRNSILVVISEKHTDELFKKKIENDISVGYAIEDTIKHLEKRGAALYTTAQSIRHNIAFKEIGFVLPYISREENTIKYLGLAVMKDSKLIGIIPASNSSGFMFIVGKNATYTKSIPNPKNEANLLSIEIMLKKREITTNYYDGRIYINIKLDLKSHLQYEYMKEPISKETLKELEDIIANMVKGEVISSIKRSQEEFECDIFGFARYFRADNPKVFKNINWVEKYLDARFNVEIKSKIINYSLINTEFKEKYKGGTQ